MDTAIRTGTTKTNGSITLLPLSIEGQKGEQALLLLQIHAHPREANVLGEESLAIVQHALLQSEGEAWHRMDGTLKELNGLFKGFIASQSVSDVHAVIAICDKEGTLHVSHAGRGEAYLVRGNTATQITEYVKGKPMPMFVHISSGELEVNDAVVLSTQRLLRTFTPAQLGALVAKGSKDALDEITLKLEGEREIATLAILAVPQGRKHAVEIDDEELEAPARASVGRKHASKGRSSESFLSLVGSIVISGATISGKAIGSAATFVLGKASRGSLKGIPSFGQIQGFFAGLIKDLKHPERKKRAHLLLIASAIAALIFLWTLLQLTGVAQRSKTRTQVNEMITQIEEDLRTADNKRILGDTASATAVLTRAEEQAQQILLEQSGTYRSDALGLLDQIRAKKEEILNIIRVSPRTVVKVSTKNPNISAQGFIGVGDGEFTVYDRSSLYQVLLNTVEEGRPLGEDDAIVDGTYFDRMKSQVFLTNGSSVIELQSGQPVTMKTEDVNGWVAGKDVETYLRYLYVLTPDAQIQKYERLSNRYGPAAPYNVNGNLTGAIDMAIDGDVFVLKEDGTVIKLFRGEAQPFSIRGAPEGALAGVTKMIKLPESNFYFLDPEKKQVLAATDGGATGESMYVRQYVFEGEIGELKDFYVDPDESHLYVLDEKGVYVVDIVK